MTYTSTWFYLGRKQTVEHDPTVVEPGEVRVAIYEKLRKQAPEPPWTSPDFSTVVDLVYASKSDEFRAKKNRRVARHFELRAKDKARTR